MIFEPNCEKRVIVVELDNCSEVIDLDLQYVDGKLILIIEDPE